MLDTSRQRDALALATYLFAGDTEGAGGILGLLTDEQRGEIAQAFKEAARNIAPEEGGGGGETRTGVRREEP